MAAQGNAGAANPAMLPPNPELNPPPLAQAAQPPPAQHQVVQPSIGLVPILSNPELKLQFGRLMSRRRLVTLIVNPGALTRVIQRTYQVMSATLGGLIPVPIEQAPFTRMVRTLILKRTQDLLESSSGMRANNRVNIARSLSVPQPIGEFLYSLGVYFAQWNGIQYDIGPPAIPAQNAPDWWTLDPQIAANYRQFMELTKDRFRQCPFPKTSDTQGQPLMFCVKDEAQNMCQIRAPGPVPTPADAFLRFIHEEFYEAPPFALDNCEYYLTEQLFTADVIHAYVSSYVINAYS